MMLRPGPPKDGALLRSKAGPQVLKLDTWPPVLSLVVQTTLGRDFDGVIRVTVTLEPAAKASRHCFAGEGVVVAMKVFTSSLTIPRIL